MIEYDNFIDTLQAIYNFDDAEKLFNALAVIAELMLQVRDDRLAGATYERTFDFDRLKIKVSVERKFNHD